MRVALILAILLLNITTAAQAEKKHRGRPATLEESFLYLNDIFADDTARYGFMTMPEYYIPLHYHFGLGMYMRNPWGLWGNGKLKKWFIGKGVIHPDEMSGIILTSYHRYLNRIPIDLEGQLKRHDEIANSLVVKGDTMSYNYDFTKGQPPIGSLMAKFPVGDTITFWVHAEEKKLFNTWASSLRAFAVVKAHKDEALVVEITHINPEKKKITKKKTGEVINQHPSEVFLLPPKGWKW